MNENAKAVIRYAANEMMIGISPSGHAQVLDANRERNAAASPLELLMIALGSCTMVDVIEILQKKRQNVIDYRIEVSGERREDFPRALTKLFVKHFVSGHSISHQAVAQAVKLSDEKYCSVAATIRPGAEIVTSFEIIETARGVKEQD